MQNICIMGDSIARGVIFDVDKKRYRFSKNSFANLLKGKAFAQVKNLGKFGATIKNGLTIFEKFDESLSNYDYTVIEFGGNDCDYDWKSVSKNPSFDHQCNVMPDLFEKEYERMIQAVIQSGSTPILMTLPPIHSERFLDWVSKGLNKEQILRFLKADVNNIDRWHEQYNQIIKSLASKHKIGLCDIHNEFSYGDLCKLLCIDGIHPNEDGHKLIADNLEHFLNKPS